LLRTKSGISKVYFTELPREVQESFHYDPQKGTEFASQTIEEVRLAQQQKIEADKKRAEQIAKNLEQVRQQREAEMQRQHGASGFIPLRLRSALSLLAHPQTPNARFFIRRETAFDGALSMNCRSDCMSM
jgi:hypothetical protein